MKKILVAIVLVYFAGQGFGQQTSLNTLYIQNPYLINPAAAGASGCFSTYLNHRNQWVGVNDSPSSNSITADGRLFKNHGFGLDARMFSAGLWRNFNIKLTYAYHIKLSKNAMLSAGLSMGMIQQNFAFSDVIASDYSDGNLASGNQSDLGLSSDAGLYFSSRRVRIGVSVPQVFARDLSFDVNTTSSDFRLVRHIQVYGEVDVIKTEKWRLSPSVLYKNAAFIGHQFDLGARVVWNDLIGLGSIYRTSYGVIGMIDLNLGKKFKLAYSYGFGGNATIPSKGTHEIMFGFQLCRKEGKALPVLVEDAPEPIKEVNPTITEESKVVEDTVIVVEEKIDLDSINQRFSTEDRLIVYALNSSETITSDNEEKVIASVAEILKSQPDFKITVVGHSCNIGDESVNLTISEKRANGIKKGLIKAGVEASRISVEAKGESEPRFPNNSEENRNKNRRVEINFWR